MMITIQSFQERQTDRRELPDRLTHCLIIWLTSWWRCSCTWCCVAIGYQQAAAAAVDLYSLLSRPARRAGSRAAVSLITTSRQRAGTQNTAKNRITWYM